MGIVKPEMPCVLVCACCYREERDRDLALKAIEEQFGRFADRSDRFPFTHTDYYFSEMGSPLYKLLVAFEDIIPPGFLPDLKLMTNAIESALASGESRTVNLDPGYLCASRFVLASTKDSPHRLYLGQGVYGELTLIYQNGAFTPLSWTYPDYREATAMDFLTRVRAWYLQRLGTLLKVGA